ncbi:hypothetical protein [Yoonia tamlensis]|nr:hypothetical protein [Yoonia tamlensis]
MRRKFGIISRLLTALALFVALGVAGLSGPAKQPVLADDVIAYLAAGGSFADLCGDTTDPSRIGAHCPACHLITFAVLPAAKVGAPQMLATNYQRLVAVAQNIAQDQALDPVRLSRAPPQA